MITFNKTTDNTFKLTYLNDGGVDLGFAVAEFKPSELKALIKLNDLYFDNLYSDDMIPADTLTLGVAMNAVIKRGIVAVGNPEFENEPNQKQAGASAIYSELTSKVCQQLKDLMENHGYEV